MTVGHPRLPLVPTLRLIRSRTWRASRVLMMMTMDASRRTMARRPLSTTRTHARTHTPRAATTAAPRNNHLPPLGLRNPCHPWRYMVPNPHRPRRPVLLRRQRCLHPSRLPNSTRAHTARRARIVTTPAAVATCPPTPRPRRPGASRWATISLLSGHLARTAALLRPRQASLWRTRGNTRPPLRARTPLLWRIPPNLLASHLTTTAWICLRPGPLFPLPSL